MANVGILKVKGVTDFWVFPIHAECLFNCLIPGGEIWQRIITMWWPAFYNMLMTASYCQRFILDFCDSEPWHPYQTPSNCPCDNFTVSERFALLLNVTCRCCLCYPEDSFVSFSFASDACWPCWILRPDKFEPSSTGCLLMSRSSEFGIKVYLCMIEISGNVLPSLAFVKYIICCGGLGRRFTCGGSFLPCWADVKYLLWQFWEKVYLWWKFLAFVSQSPRLSRCEIFAMEFPEEGLPMMEFSDHVLLGCRHVKYLLWIFPEKAYHDGNFWPCSSGVRTGEVVFAGEIFRRRFTHDGNFWPCHVLISQVEQMWCMCSRVLRRRFVF